MKKVMIILIAMIVSLSSFARIPEETVVSNKEKSTITKVFNITVKTVKSCIKSYNSETGEVLLNDGVISNLAISAGIREFAYSPLIKFNFRGNRFAISYKNDELLSGRVSDRDAKDIKRLILN